MGKQVAVVVKVDHHTFRLSQRQLETLARIEAEVRARECDPRKSFHRSAAQLQLRRPAIG